MKNLSFLFAFLLFSVCINAQTIMGRQVVDQFSTNNYGALTYALTWVPSTYNNTTRTYPLIISMHGAGETGTTVATLSKLYTASPRAVAGRIADGWEPVAINPRTGVQDSFIVVSPQASSWSYNYTELKYILPSILAKYRVDRSRIYLVGLSAGGGGTFSTFGSRDSLFIKNFAAMATASSAGVNPANGYTDVQVEAGLRYGSAYGVRMWTIAGEEDYLLNTDVRYHDSTNASNPAKPNKLTVIQSVGHSAWGKVYDPSFRPVNNYYGKTGSCNSGCNSGGITVAPNTNGSTVRGSGITQDSLNLYEWLLLSQRTETTFSPNINDYRSNAARPAGAKWNSTSSWKRFDGQSWANATALPTATAGIITITASDSIDVDVAASVDQLVIEAGGVLQLSNAALTINDGPGNDFLIDGTVNLTNTASIIGAGSSKIKGILNWTGGTLGIVTVSENGSQINVSGSSNKILSGNFTNYGAFNWSTSGVGGNIQITAAKFYNNGLLSESFTSNKGFINGGGAVAFVNNGTFKKLSTNTFSNNTVNFTNTGTLQGIGAFSFSGTVTNTGIIKPGNSPGILTVTGDVVEGQNSQIKIEIYDGSGAGTGHNRLDLTGDINLSGNTITVTENPSAPSLSYIVMTTTGSFSGTFSGASLPSGYSITYSQQSISVTKGVATLPASWGTFDVTADNASTELRWTTIQENNTDYFVVEHSLDGILFTTAGKVKASGNSALIKSYHFIHAYPSAVSTNYYRIKLVDMDAKTSYSATIKLNMKQEKPVLKMLSNVVTDNLQVSVQSEKLQVRIIDMTGKVFYNGKLTNGIMQINTSMYAKGMYKIIADDGSRLITNSFIKY
ncbi:MAG: hypothetical protein QM725_09970 [Lacibacter sp.]